jgi:hypothetical protein
MFIYYLEEFPASKIPTLQLNNNIRVFGLSENQGKQLMLSPVLIPHGSCTDNCSLAADNSQSF